MKPPFKPKGTDNPFGWGVVNGFVLKNPKNLYFQWSWRSCLNWRDKMTPFIVSGLVLIYGLGLLKRVFAKKDIAAVTNKI